MYILDSDRSGQFCDLSIISQWKKIERMKIIRNTLKHRLTGRIDTTNRNIAASDSSSCRQGHLRSWKVTRRFSAILLIETSQSDENTIDVPRLMIRIDWYATWPFGSRSNFKHDVLRSNYSSFDAFWQEKHKAGKMSGLYWIKSYYWKTFFVKTAIF